MITNKEFLVNATNEADDIFCVYELNGKYYSFEHIWENYPQTTICEWDSLEEIVENINWLWWIIGIDYCNIKNDNLKELLIKKETLW